MLPKKTLKVFSGKRTFAYSFNIVKYEGKIEKFRKISSKISFALDLASKSSNLIDRFRFTCRHFYYRTTENKNGQHK
jgi:hypothetical protein